MGAGTGTASSFPPALSPGEEAATRSARSMLPLVAPVVVAGAAVLVPAALLLTAPQLTAQDGFRLLGLLLVALVLDALPIDLEDVPVGGTSLANVVIVATAVLYGWEAAAVLAVATQLGVDLARRRPPLVTAYNGAVYGLSAAAAGGLAAAAGAARPGSGATIGALVAGAALAAIAFNIVDLGLVALAVARSSRQPVAGVAVASARATAPVAAIMASLGAVLLIVWQREPLAALLLLGPLAALALHQRSTAAAYRATRLALTDPLTGLGNARAYHALITREIEASTQRGRPLALCLLDVDDFKSVNDTHGHPQGDRVLAFVATQLRRDGEAFRMGGDEFALVLPGRDLEEARVIARTVEERIRTAPSPIGEEIRVSTGVAAFPREAGDLEGLLQAADRALYADKARHARAAAQTVPDTSELPALGRLRGGRDREARLRAAASLAHAVDARDSSTGRHSWMVGELAARITQAIGLEGEMVELARIAGRLHDLGKLAIPEEVLRKPDALSDDERTVIERHAEIGFRILDALDVEPVANWVLHHHERWDGRGYPDGLAGETIPLGARILFVADSFDAMTSDRVYRAGMSRERATRELVQQAGTQFDPGIVARFVAAVERGEIDGLRAASESLAV